MPQPSHSFTTLKLWMRSNYITIADILVLCHMWVYPGYMMESKLHKGGIKTQKMGRKK